MRKSLLAGYLCVAVLSAFAGNSRAGEQFGNLPLYFERDDGPAGGTVRYLARGSGVTLSLGSGEMIVTPRSGSPVQMRLRGTAGPKSVEPLERQEGVSNYYIGNDPRRWRTGVPHFSRVRWQEAYPGIDVIYYGRQKSIEYDFIVAPGADPKRIELEWDGAIRARLESNGDLVLGDVRLQRPHAYQTLNGVRVDVAVAYRVKPDRRITFRLGRFDRSLPLVIDPVLSYTNYIGSTGADAGRAIAVDGNGNAYICGSILNLSVPNHVDGFVVKLNAAGTTAVYTTYLGGSTTDSCSAIAVDADGNAYAAGPTESANFTVVNAFQPSFGGQQDGFVTKLSPTGTIVYSTFLGGPQGDSINGIAVDAQGSAYVTGWTVSPAFPTTPGAFRTLITGTGDAFCTKLNPQGNGLAYSTLFGGAALDEGIAIALDGANNAYVAGITAFGAFPVTANAFQKLPGGGGTLDGFVVKVNPAGSGLTYSTYLGGGTDDRLTAIAVDEAGHAYIAGRTISTNYPTTENAYDRTLEGQTDVVVTKLNSHGSAAIYSSYLGGSGSDGAAGIQVNAAGHTYVTGTIGGSGNFPTVGGPLSSVPGGTSDVFLTVFNPLGEALVYSTYFGGSGADDGTAIAIDAAGSAYIAGRTTSINLPTTPGSHDTSANGGDDGFAAKLSGFDLPACRAPIGATSSGASSTGGNADIPVNAPAGCNWNTISGIPFIAIGAGATGSGTGSATYTVAANSETVPRAGSVSVAGNILQIIQPPESLEAPYADVLPTHPFANHIALMKANAITSGCNTNQYCPDGTTTRGQMAVFIIRALLGGDAFPFPATPFFTDVPATHPLFKWVQKMREFGITSGCGATTYCPDESVTRGQMAVFILRALVGNTFTFSPTPYFTDVPASHPFFPFVQKMKEWGVTAGCGPTSYCVDTPTTRGQMAVFIVRAFFSPR